MNEKVKETQYNVKPTRRYLKKGELPISQKSLDEMCEEIQKLRHYNESVQDLIKGKDKYIAKLLEENKILKTIIHGKEQLIVTASKELNDLREFAKLFIAEMVDVDCAKDCNTYDEYVSCYGRELNEAQFDLVKKVVDKYGQ